MGGIETASIAELQELLGSTDWKAIADAAEEFVSRHVRIAVPRMLEILRSTNDGRVRNAVAIALSDLGEPQAFQRS